jgi:hypothetical protein
MQKPSLLLLDIRNKLSGNSVPEFCFRYRVLIGCWAHPACSTGYLGVNTSKGEGSYSFTCNVSPIRLHGMIHKYTMPYIKWMFDIAILEETGS